MVSDWLKGWVSFLREVVGLARDIVALQKEMKGETPKEEKKET